MLKHMKIGFKLQVGFLVVSLLCVVNAGIGLLAMHGVTQEIHRLTTNELQGLTAAGRIEAGLSGLRRSELAMLAASLHQDTVLYRARAQLGQDYQDNTLDPALAEAGRGRDVARRDVAHVGHLVHDDSDEDARHPKDDDAEPFLVGDRHVELAAQVDHGDHLAAQVDHAADELRRAGHAGDRLHPDDLLHLQRVDAILLAGEDEGEELASDPRGGGGGGGGGRGHAAISG